MLRLVCTALVLVAALVVSAWFALGIRQSHDLDAATALISGRAALSPAAARRADALLRRAGQLNPDTSVALARAQLALREGDARRAQAIARGVTRSEPDNIDAWATFGSASGHDPAAFRHAQAQVSRLAPAVR